MTIAQSIARPMARTIARAQTSYPFANMETGDLIARMQTPPTNARVAAIDALLGTLKTDGVLPKLDGLWLMGAADAQAAKLNWIAARYDLTLVGAPTFTADRGYNGDGAGARLDTNFSPPTIAAAKYTLNSAHLALWSLTDTTSGSAYEGGANGTTITQLNPRSSTLAMRGTINSGSADNYGANATSLGHFVLNRSGAAATEGYWNGVAIGTTTRASSSIPTGTFKLCGLDVTNFGTRQLMAAHMGSSLSAAEVLAAYNALNTYKTAIGA